MFSLFYGFYHYFEKFVHYSGLVKTIINLKSKKHENEKKFFAIRIHSCGGGSCGYGRAYNLAVYIAGKKSDFLLVENIEEVLLYKFKFFVGSKFFRLCWSGAKNFSTRLLN